MWDAIDGLEGEWIYLLHVDSYCVCLCVHVSMCALPCVGMGGSGRRCIQTLGFMSARNGDVNRMHKCCANELICDGHDASETVSSTPALNIVK